MAVTRMYRCNLCSDAVRPQDVERRLIGLYWKHWPQGWEERPVYEVENHICASCLSSLQALPTRCGAGHECNGGPNCDRDHSEAKL